MPSNAESRLHIEDITGILKNIPDRWSLLNIEAISTAEDKSANAPKPEPTKTFPLRALSQQHQRIGLISKV